METAATWTLNVITLLAFIANTAVTYLSMTGIFGYTNKELSLKYQTLVTPVGFAFAIWGPIFLLEGAFTLGQLTPMLHASSDVRGVSYWFVGVCLAQVAWTLAFSNDIVWLALVLMLSIWGMLGATLVSHQRATSDGPTEAWRYALFRLPFLLHFGWITAASFVNANVALVAYAGSSHSMLLGAAIVSLAFLLILGLYNPATTSRFGADPVYSGVIAWALFGVGRELKAPVVSLTLWCPPLVTETLSGVAALLAALVATYAVAMAILRLVALRTSREAGDAQALAHLK